MAPRSFGSLASSLRASGLFVACVVVVACSGRPDSSTLGSTAAPPSLTLGPTAATAPSPGALTDEEVAGLTGGGLVAVPVGAPAPRIDAAAAEATVRAAYPGTRTTLGVRRVALQLSGAIRVGWFVALTPAQGAPCTLHAGLLPRAIEGGIVDDQTGEMFWEFICG